MAKQKNTAPTKRVFAETIDEVAAVFGVTNTTIRRWIRGEGAPGRIRAGYDMGKWVQWFIRSKAAPDVAGSSMSDAKVRLQTARADREEMRVAKDAGALISSDDAQRDRLAILRWCLGVMERAPSEIQTRIAGKRPREQRRTIAAYFVDVRSDAVAKYGATP